MSPTMDPAELTMASWAKLIEAYADVPGAYRSFLDAYLSDGRPFPYTVLVPSREHILRRRKTEKLVVDLGGRITVIERTGNAVTAVEYPVDGISYVEARTILLYSRIKICGLSAGGVHTCSAFRFSSISDHLFLPLLATMRRAPASGSPPAEGLEPEKFDALAATNYKFRNLARRNLLPGEEVLLYYLQPEIRKRVFGVFGRAWHRTISGTHLSILTDRELILLKEEERGPEKEKYGATRDYIALDKIVSLELKERQKNLLEFSIQLPADEHLELIFEPPARREIEQLIEKVKEVKSYSRTLSMTNSGNMRCNGSRYERI